MPTASRIRHLKSTTSTNDYARKLAEAGAPSGTAVRADVQTRGRGRGGARWLSPPGGLWMSVILRPPEDFEAMNLIPASSSLAVAKTLERLGAHAKIRWPNDVTVNDSKIAGLLCESEVQGGRPRWIIVGVGLNANNQPPRLKAASASSVATSMMRVTGRRFDLALLSRALRDSVLDAYGELRRNGSDAIIRECNAYQSLQGRKVRMTLSDGVVEGVALRMETDGRLALRIDGHVRRFRPEDVPRVELLKWSREPE